METKVVNSGKSLEHKVNFESGLHQTNTAKTIK
jgi:hypothetical protein